MKEVFTTQSGEQMVVDVGERLVTNFNGNTIFRGKSGGRDLVVKFSTYHLGAEREWEGLRRVHEAGIPSPVPVAFIPGDRPGLITENIPGEFLDYHPEPSLRYSLGVLVKAMHDNTKIDGFEWERHGKKDFSFYDRKIAQWEKGRVGGKAITLLKELERRIGDSFRMVDPVFAHNDLHDKQAIVNEGGLYLIDFEFWREAHPMGDLAMYLLNVVRNGTNEDYFWQLCNGYAKEGGSYSVLQKDILTFLLLFASCQGLEYYASVRPSYIDMAIKQHQGAMAFVDQEKLWKKL